MGAGAGSSESRRYRLMREAYVRAIAKGSAVEKSRVDELFGSELSEEERLQLFSMLSDVTKQYAKACREEFEEVTAEYDTSNKLADLERLCAERGVIEGIPPEAIAAADAPKPTAETRAALYRAMQAEKETLKQLLESAKAERAEAEAALAERRKAAEERAAQLSPVVQGLKGLHDVNEQWVYRA